MLGLVIAFVELLPPWPFALAGDFQPFVMTVEDWRLARINYADGTSKAGTATHRVDYRRRDDWTLTFLSDDAFPIQVGSGQACKDGTFQTFDAQGTITVRSKDPALCNGVGRWIHYGLSQSYGWERAVIDGRVTYTSPGERVVFDLVTGLPMLYEAGPSGSATVGERTVFRLEHWGP